MIQLQPYQRTILKLFSTVEKLNFYPRNVRMKYSIQETGEKVTPYKLFRYDEYVGVPNNAELEFWMELLAAKEKIQELESTLSKLDKENAKMLDRIQRLG